MQKFLSKAAATVASLIKIPLMSRPLTKAPKVAPERELVILGNGPSLNDTASHREFLADKDLLAVNFAANAPLFVELKPALYVLADPHFFDPQGDEKVDTLWRNISAADWPLTLYVPAKHRRQVQEQLKEATNVGIATFNLTPIEGFGEFCRRAYRLGLGMPRPRNVLIPSIMIGLRAGYRRIYLAGADHSWSKTLWVDDNNRVVTVQPHFYPDDEKERERVTAAYANIHMHDIYTSFAIAFRSYFSIADYARTLPTEIINITPGSFIDAFPRMKV